MSNMRIFLGSNTWRDCIKVGSAVLLFLSSCVISITANAYTFLPTDAEFNSWPGYCRAVYAKTSFGSQTKFATRVRPEHDAALAVIEGSGIYGPHHSCTGMIWLNRARLEQDAASRNFMLNQSITETMFAYVRSDRKSPYLADIAVQLAMAHMELGDVDTAMTTLSQFISDQPGNPVAYSGLAILQRKEGDLTGAVATLISGDKAVNGQSAEIKYNLGLMVLELGRTEEAVGYADAAYSMGYPLPGLRAKLKRVQSNTGK